MKHYWLRFREFQRRKRAEAKLAFRQSGLLRFLGVYALVSPFIVNPLAVAAGLGYVPPWIPAVGWTLGYLNAWVLLPALLIARMRQQAVPPPRRHGRLRHFDARSGSPSP